MSEVNVVRSRLGAKIGYSVRAILDGVETEVFWHSNSKSAEAVSNRLRSLPSDVAALAFTTLLMMRPLAAPIAAGDQEQGKAGYATKAHMVSWGAEMLEQIDNVLELAGLFAKE